MFSFGTASMKQLDTCHQDVKVIMDEVIKIVNCSVLEGHRDPSLQADFVARGLSKTLDSLHCTNPSMAWHALPYFDADPHIDWNHRPSMYYLAGIILGVAARLRGEGKITNHVRWGGDWDRDGDVREAQWNDLAHYELRGD